MKISPSLINTLGFQKKKRPELHRGTNAHVCRHRADVYGTGSQGRTGDPGEAGQGQRRAFYRSLFSGLLCWKRGTAFWEPLILVRHLPCWHKSCLCKARALKNRSDANLRQRFTPHRNEYSQLCKQKDSALLVSISRLARTGGSRDADWTDGLNSLVWKNSVGCWDLWLFAELPPSQAPMVGVRGWLWKNPHCSATTVPAKSIWHSCISVIDSISYAHCYILPWESPSIQVNVFKSVWCSRSQWFLVPLNGREQRYSLESRRLREIASEAEELLLFPWLGQHFLSEEMRRWEESSTCHILITAFTIKCFCSWKKRGWHRASCVANAWMFTEPQLYCCLPFPWWILKGWSCCSFLIQQSLSPRVSWWGYATNIWGHWRNVDCPAWTSNFTLHAVTVCKKEKIKPEQ